MAGRSSAPSTGVSFSLAGRNEQGRRAQARVALFGEEEEDEETPRDVPLGVKRKRNEPREANVPRVIPMQTHTDWREDRKKRLGLLDRHASELGSLASMRRPGQEGKAPVRGEATDNAPERAFTEPQQHGLVVKRTETPEEGEEKPMERDTTPPAHETAPTPPHESETDEAAAIRELLAGAQGKRRDGGDRVIAQPPEEEMLQHDVDTRPDAPTLDDYSTMPIEEFGAAMLRGMGWKDGSGVGRSRSGPTKAPEVQKRAALLGLGAKERQVPSASKRPERRRDDRKYTPVVRSDSLRGEPSRDHPRDDRRDSRRDDRDRRDDRRESRRDDYRRDDYRRDDYRRGDDRRDDYRRDDHRDDYRRDDRRDDYRRDSRDARRDDYRRDSRDSHRSRYERSNDRYR